VSSRSFVRASARALSLGGCVVLAACTALAACADDATGASAPAPRDDAGPLADASSTAVPGLTPDAALAGPVGLGAVVWGPPGATPRGGAEGPEGLVVLVRSAAPSPRPSDPKALVGTMHGLFGADPLVVPPAPEPSTCALPSTPSLAGPRLEAGEISIANGDVPDGSDGRGQGIIVRPTADLAYAVDLYTELLRDRVELRVQALRGAFGDFLSDRVLRWPLPDGSDVTVARTPGAADTLVVTWPSALDAPRVALLDDGGAVVGVCRLAPSAPGEARLVAPAVAQAPRVALDFVSVHEALASTGRRVRLEAHDVSTHDVPVMERR
jgi:hypothetical protein